MASRRLRSDPAAVVALLSGPGRSDLAQFLARQRWFAAKTRGVGTVAVRDWAILEAEGDWVRAPVFGAELALVARDVERGEPYAITYRVPLV